MAPSVGQHAPVQRVSSVSVLPISSYWGGGHLASDWSVGGDTGLSLVEKEQRVLE